MLREARSTVLSSSEKITQMRPRKNTAKTALKASGTLWTIQSTRPDHCTISPEFTPSIDKSGCALPHCPENKILQILLQVNVDSDENKGGIKTGKIDELIKYVLSERI